MNPEKSSPASLPNKVPVKERILFVVCVLVLIFLRLPAFINAEVFFSSDEAFNAMEILWLMEGTRPFFFYHEYVGYQGVLNGWSAIPFFAVLGPTALAYKLPAVLFYLVFVWTVWKLTREIAPDAGAIVLVLLMFSPPNILLFSTQNFPHVLISLLGNWMFILFIRMRSAPEPPTPQQLFGLFFCMGIAVYSYTLSILHIGTLAIIYLMTHPDWTTWRSRGSLTTFRSYFSSTSSKRHTVARVLDVVIVVFLAASTFSYIFGGFGIDVAGISLFQINKLHKPVLQVTVLIAIRLLLNRSDWGTFKQRGSDWINSLQTDTQRRWLWSACGFLLGLFPRILSILTGESKRGGSGFDTDLVPTNIIDQWFEFFERALPQVLGLFEPVHSLAGTSPGMPFAPLSYILYFGIAFLIALAGFTFYRTHGKPLKQMIRLQGLSFHPTLPLVLFPVITLLALSVSTTLPMPRYFISLYGIFIIWVALYLAESAKRYRGVVAVLLILWCSYYSIVTYKLYRDEGVIENFRIRTVEDPLHEVIRFVKSKNLPVAYAEYWVAHKATYLNRQSVTFVDFSTRPIKGIAQKARAASETDFAVIAETPETQTVYENFLKNNAIQYQMDAVGSYWVFWKFTGNEGAINRLRSLIP